MAKAKTMELKVRLTRGGTSWNCNGMGIWASDRNPEKALKIWKEKYLKEHSKALNLKGKFESTKAALETAARQEPLDFGTGFEVTFEVEG